MGSKRGDQSSYTAKRDVEAGGDLGTTSDVIRIDRLEILPIKRQVCVDDELSLYPKGSWMMEIEKCKVCH